MPIDNINAAADTANLDSYGLCVVYWGDSNGENKRIVCEGLKVTRKCKAEAKKDCAQTDGYDWELSDFEYEWEIDEPHDYNFFDERFKAQINDKHGLTITAYSQDQNGTWVKKDTLKSCIISDTDREYGNGISRSIKGSALGIE